MGILTIAPITIMYALGSNIQIGVIGDIKRSFSLSSYDTQYMVSVYSLFMAVGQLIFGIFSDTYGRKKMSLIGFFIFAISTMLIYYAKSYEMVLIARAFEAVGASMCYISAYAIVRDMYSDYKLSQAYTLLSSCMALCTIAVPYAAIKLSEYYDWAEIFLMCSVLVLSFLVFTYKSVPETAPNLELKKLPSIKNIAKQYWHILNSKNFFLLALVGSNGSALFAVYATTLPIILDDIGVDKEMLPIYYAIPPTIFFFSSITLARFIEVLGFIRAVKISVFLFIVATSIAIYLKDETTIRSIFIPISIYASTAAFVLSYTPPLALEKLKSVAGSASSMLSGVNFAAAAIATTITTKIFSDNFHYALVSIFCIYAIILFLSSFKIIRHIRDSERYLHEEGKEEDILKEV